MKIAICEDKQLTREATEKLIYQVAKTEKMQVEIFSYPISEALLFALRDLPELDLLILDIQMGTLEGDEFSKKMRQKKSKKWQSYSSVITLIMCLMDMKSRRLVM